MDEQRLAGVADCHILRFAVHGDRNRHLHIGGFIHINVADAVGVPQHGNAAVVHDIADELLAAAGDDEVDERVLLQHGGDVLAGMQQLREIRRKPDIRRRLPERITQGGVRPLRLAPALEQHGIAALERQRRNLHQRIRPALENHADDPNRAGHAVHFQPRRDFVRHRCCADGVGQIRQRAKPVRHGAQLLFAEFQPAKQGRCQPVRLRLMNIRRVRRKNIRLMIFQHLRHPQKRRVSRFQRRSRQRPSRLPAVCRHLVKIVHPVLPPVPQKIFLFIIAWKFGTCNKKTNML